MIFMTFMCLCPAFLMWDVEFASNCRRSNSRSGCLPPSIEHAGSRSDSKFGECQGPSTRIFGEGPIKLVISCGTAPVGSHARYGKRDRARERESFESEREGGREGGERKGIQLFRHCQLFQIFKHCLRLHKAPNYCSG